MTLNRSYEISLSLKVLKSGMCSRLSAMIKIILEDIKSQVEISKTFLHKIVNIFLSIIFSVCFGCSKEPSH